MAGKNPPRQHVVYLRSQKSRWESNSYNTSGIATWTISKHSLPRIYHRSRMCPQIFQTSQLLQTSPWSAARRPHGGRRIHTPKAVQRDPKASLAKSVSPVDTPCVTGFKSGKSGIAGLLKKSITGVLKTFPPPSITLRIPSTSEGFVWPVDDTCAPGLKSGSARGLDWVRSAPKKR